MPVRSGGVSVGTGAAGRYTQSTESVAMHESKAVLDCEILTRTRSDIVLDSPIMRPNMSLCTLESAEMTLSPVVLALLAERVEPSLLTAESPVLRAICAALVTESADIALSEDVLPCVTPRAVLSTETTESLKGLLKDRLAATLSVATQLSLVVRGNE